MKYIILAAGIGRRLHPLTNENPKALFKLDENTTVIERTVNEIKNADENAQIIVVTGFYKEKFIEILKCYKDIIFVHNPFYGVTNSIASLWFAREHLDGDTVILNADIVFDRSLCQDEIAKKTVGTLVLVDSSIKTDGDYNVQVHDNKVTVMSKELKEYFGEYAGITKLDAAGAKVLKEEVDYMINKGYYDQWYENALVQVIFTKNFELKYVDIAVYSWTEIDNVDDLLQAKRIHFGR